MDKKLIVLHLEDDPLEADLIRESVLGEGVECEFHVATDAHSFKRLLTTANPDLILSDMKVPGFCGHDALEMVRAKHPELPFIFVSGSMGEERAIETLRGGATDYVLKDRLQRLVPAMRRAIEEFRSRQKAEEATRALQESEQRLELALRGADLGLWDWDIITDKAVFNDRWASTLGHSLQELEPHIETWKSRIHPDDHGRVMSQIDAHLTGDTELFEAEHRMRTKDGQWRWVLNRGRIVQRDQKGDAIRMAGTHLDITERKVAEQTNQQLEAQLQQSQKMESLGTLAGGIAHDFNNILGAIIGFSELVHEGLPKDSNARADMDEVLKAANRAKVLVEQILTFSRQTPQDLTPIQLPSVLHGAVQFLRATIPTTVEVKLEIEPGTPTILGEVTQLHQVIVNLATNSVQAMPDADGTIEISLRPFYVNEDFAGAVAHLEAGEHSLLTVADTGCGIQPEIQPRIFDPFFTTKGPGNNSGLGLAVVHGVIKKHRGAIRVISGPDAGAKFEIFLPAAQNEPANPTAPEADQPADKAGDCVMLVDDEPALVRVGKLMLERLGFVVEVFTNSGAAWEAFEAAPDRFQLIITDQTMPKLTGLELSNRILKIRPELPVILTTGYHASANQDGVRAAGVADLLMKPYTIETLSNAVKSALDNNRTRTRS